MKNGAWGIQSLKAKYLYQHPILDHCQPAFATQCDRPSFHNRLKKAGRFIILCILIFTRAIQSLKAKYLYQHPILDHCQPAFATQCDRPSFHTRLKKQAEL
jgi:DNA-directed RNA polymerase subunit L